MIFKSMQRSICVVLFICIFMAVVGGGIYAQTILPSYIKDVTSEYQFKPVKIGGAGFIMTVLLHPKAENLAYCCADVGGAYKWDETTKSWTQLCTTERMPQEVINASDTAIDGNDSSVGPGIKRTWVNQVEAIAIDPQDPNVLFLACGKSGYGFLLKSTDAGKSFQLTNLKKVRMIGNGDYRTTADRIAVDPNNSNIVYFGSRMDGLWKSIDKGMNWAQVSTADFPIGTQYNGSPVGVANIKFDTTSGIDANGCTKRIYVSVAGKGVMKSEDAGATWSLINSSFALDMQVSRGVMYAGLSDIGISKYTPASGFTNIPANGNKQIYEMAVSPSDPNVVYAMPSGGQNIYRTTNGGTSWQILSTTPTNNFKAPNNLWKENTDLRSWLSIGQIVIDPNDTSKMWFAEGMGVWRSTNISNTNNSPMFYDISNGIEELVGVDAISAPGNKYTFMGWDRIGFTYTGSLDKAPNYQIGLTQRFSSGTSVSAAGKNPNFLVASVADQRDSTATSWNNTFSGYSEDGGATWKVFNSVKVDNSQHFQGAVNNPVGLKFGEIAVSASNTSNMVWIPRNGVDAAYYSKDKGSTWQQSSLPSGYANACFKYLVAKRVLAADQVTDGVFYLYSMSGDLLKSTDGGATFIKVANNLPTSIWNCKLKAQPNKAGYLWFATGPDARAGTRVDGLYSSSDSGATFGKVPNVDECWSIGFGKEKEGLSNSTIYMYGKIGGVWGLFRSTDNASSWDLCSQYPLGLMDIVDQVNGDINTYGKILLAFNGNGFAYGQIAGTTESPAYSPTPTPIATPVATPIATTAATPKQTPTSRPTTKPTSKKTVALKNVKPTKLYRKTNKIIGVVTSYAAVKLYYGKRCIKSVKATKKGTFTLSKLNLKKYYQKKLKLIVTKSGYNSKSKTYTAVKK